MDLSESVFTSIDAIRSADTGAGGLAQTGGGTAYINRMAQRDDPNYDDNRADYWPMVTVDVIDKSDTGFGSTGGEGLLVRMTIKTQRDPGRSSQNSVAARMRTKYDNATLASQTGWVFSPMTLEREYQLKASGVCYLIVQEYSLRAGTSAAELVGRQASVTFSGSEGAAFGSTLVGHLVDEDIEIDMIPVERWEDTAERLTRQTVRGRITAMFTIKSMTPVVPVGTAGVLTCYEDTANSKKITYTNAVVLRRRRSASTDGDSEPQRLYLTFGVTCTGVAGTFPMVAS